MHTRRKLLRNETFVEFHLIDADECEADYMKMAGSLSA